MSDKTKDSADFVARVSPTEDGWEVEFYKDGVLARTEQVSGENMDRDDLAEELESDGYRVEWS